MKKNWEYCEVNNEQILELSSKLNISKILAKILISRGITEQQDVQKFLEPTRDDFYDPYLISDMEKAVNRILTAIEEKQKVIIYGDYDVDGITSITVLKKFLEERGIIVDYYIPNRLEEGYGLNEESVKNIIKNKYNLIITVDCGISAIEEIDICNKYGIETIITDHHEPLEILPKAYAIVNPKVKDNKYPFRGLAGVGVVFKLIQAIGIKLELDAKDYLKYLDLVCVGTISDIVPLIDENRVIAKLGLKLISRTNNVGLRELVKSIGYKNIDSVMISYGIAPRVNACGRMGFQEEAIRLFLTQNIESAKTITKELNEYNAKRQEIERKIFEEALLKIDKENINEMNTIVLSGDGWHHGVIGIVASKITEKFYKPTILVCFDEEEGKGSGRSISGFDLHGALCLCSEYLEKYGGHEMAVGLTVNKSKFNEFKKRLEEIAKQQKIEKIVPILRIDEQLKLKDLSKNLVEELKILEPFGEKNKEPIFTIKNLKIDAIRSISDGKHLKIILKDNCNFINAIGFNLGYLINEYTIGDKVDIAGIIEINSFNGRENIQINLKDIMKATH